VIHGILFGIIAKSPTATRKIAQSKKEKSCHPARKRHSE